MVTYQHLVDGEETDSDSDPDQKRCRDRTRFLLEERKHDPVGKLGVYDCISVYQVSEITKPSASDRYKKQKRVAPAYDHNLHECTKSGRGRVTAQAKSDNILCIQ